MSIISFPHIPVEYILPVSDRVAVQGGVGTKELIQLRNIYGGHSCAALVTDPKDISDGSIVHVMAFREQLAADERIHEVSTGPEARPFPADVVRWVDGMDARHLEDCGRD